MCSPPLIAKANPNKSLFGVHTLLYVVAAGKINGATPKVRMDEINDLRFILNLNK